MMATIVSSNSHNGHPRLEYYNDGMNGPKHEVLHETTHGSIKMTRPCFDKTPYGIRRRMDKEYVYITFKFPKKLGLALTKVLYAEESDEMMSFLKTRKEETVWE